MTKLLLVEDDPLIAMEAQLYLEEAGFDVVGHAVNAPEAIAMGQDLKPDLALLDIRLAQGTNGVDAAHGLSAIGIPGLFVTSFCDQASDAGKVGLGCLEKPFSRTSLIASVRAAEAILNGDQPASPIAGLTLYV